jgi:arylsulfatase A-like enzyme
MKMTFNKTLAFISAGILGVYNNMASAQSHQCKPNIILILLDDVGYSDLGCYGSEIKTPNIDRLAENGIRLRNFYNMARSAPTRGSLMTGLYAHQEGQGALARVPGYPNYQGYANNENAFISEVLHSVGYFNIMTGKWHIGFDRGVTPITRGFDRSLNSPVGGYYFSTDHDDFPALNGINNNMVKKTKCRLYRNDKLIPFTDPSLPKDWYSSNLWTKCGLEYVNEALASKKPFFWYLAFNGAHFPLQAPAETIAKYRGKYMKGWDEIRNERYKKQLKMGLFSTDEKLTPRNPKIKNWDELTTKEKDRQDQIMSIYAADIEEIDRNIGLLVDYLKEKGEFENTMIILLSDNGGNAEGGLYGKCNGVNPGAVDSNVFLGTAWADVANTPYFLYKHHGHEGGCNTPLIISYPNGIDKKFKGSIDKTNYGHVSDIMKTFVELTGAGYPKTRDGYKVQPMEGTSLLPILKGQEIKRNKPIIVEHEGNKMLRKGDWKIVQEYTETEWMLYNIKEDPTEMHNLAKKEPQKLNEMVKLYKSEAKRIGVEPGIKFKVGEWYTPVDKY